MDGVEILAIEEVAVEFAFNWMAFFICFCVIFVILVLFGIIMSTIYDDWKQLIVGVITGTLLGGLFGLSFGFGIGIPTEFENQYKVTISDEVSMNDFLDRYEIIDQEGKIYTVRERND